MSEKSSEGSLPPLPFARHANIIAENLRRIDAALPLFPLPPKSLRPVPLATAQPLVAGHVTRRGPNSLGAAAEDSEQ